jgi:hypothetical protein
MKADRPQKELAGKAPTTDVKATLSPTIMQFSLTPFLRLVGQVAHPGNSADVKPDRIFSFAWSRDGKQLAVSHGTLTHDVILISNFMEQR